MTRFVIALSASLVAATLSAAPSGKGDAKSEKAASPVEVIRKTLDLTVSMEHQAQPLPTVLAAIGEEHKLAIVLDRSAIGGMGVDPGDMSVDFKCKGVKLRTALRDLLNQFNLSFGIVGESVVVSTEENVIYRQLKHRVSIDIDNVPLNKALRDLSAAHGVNVIVDPRTLKMKLGDAPVTLQVDDVAFETVVRLLAEIAGLRPVRMGNVLFVTSEERAEKLKDSDTLVPTPGLPGAGPGVFLPGLPGGIAPGGLVPAVPANPAGNAPAGAPKEEKKEPEKE